MEFLPICVLLVMCFVAKGFSDSFLCYECENCEETLSDSLLKSCPAATTLAPTTVPTQQTTASPSAATETTTSPSAATETTTTPSAASETTTTPPVATETTNTPPAATETTTTPPAGTETTTTPPAATETTTTPPAGTEATTTPPAATQSSTIPPAATESSPIPPAATESSPIPSAATESSPIPPAATESSPIPPAATETATIPPAAIETTTIAPEATEAPIIPPQSGNSNAIGYGLRRSRSLRSVLREESKAHCFSINIKEGNVVKTNKGCIEVPKTKDVCEALIDKYGKSTENCKVCESDRCNSSAALKFSFAIFVITILISVFVNK